MAFSGVVRAASISYRRHAHSVSAWRSFPGAARIGVRHLHVFKDHVDTVHVPPGGTAPAADPEGLIDAAIARIDNVGFDGPVIADWRESSAPDSLVRFEGSPFQPVQDPRNPQNIGYDIGYFVRDIAEGPGPALHLDGVDPLDIESAALTLTLNVNFLAQGSRPAEYALRARVNGRAWHERKLTPAEAAFFVDGPTTLDADGNPMGDPGSQGRLALVLDLPLEELVAGDNTVEFVTVNVPTSYPPVLYNVDLVMKRR
jgi:hypothetical protein